MNDQPTSLFAQYVKERKGQHIIEDERGFATFTIEDGTCYIEDIFVLPKYRRMNVGMDFENQIIKFAKERHCDTLAGSVCPGTNGAHTSLEILLASRYKLSHIDGALIFFSKEI